MNRNTLVLTAASAMLAVSGTAAQDAAEPGVQERLDATIAALCYGRDSAAAEAYPDQSWTLGWREDWADTDTSVTLHQFFCGAGAYNAQFVYYIVDQYDEARPVAFAVPEFEVVYENGDSEGAVEDIALEGMTAVFMLTNSEFDPDTQTITEYQLWRGLGDASAAGVWTFKEGRFVLETYDVDASYDGEVNPARLVDYR